jgi:GcrA cell cycle regulator
MLATEPTWTTERVELLKSHFASGLSCREIANAIGVSRNAVIGKLSRLNLTREKTVKTRRPGPKHDGTRRRTRSVPQLQYQMLRELYAEAEPSCEEAIQSEHRCSLLELSEEKCRWPISTPGTEGFCFGGNRPLEGLPYCAGHSRLAYRPSGQRLARS